MSMQPPVPQQARILVIDDEPDLRTLYELTLLREGYRVEAAGDLLQARQQLSENRFDAVITDMRLPDGLGLELLRDIVNQQRSERCVVITAHGSAENAVEALKAGAFDYLTKPVDLKQFRMFVDIMNKLGKMTGLFPEGSQILLSNSEEISIRGAIVSKFDEQAAMADSKRSIQPVFILAVNHLLDILSNKMK